MWAPPKKGLSCGQVFCLDKCWIQSRQSRERIRMKHSRDRIAAPLWGSTESWWVCLPQCCSWDIIKIKCVPPHPFLHPFLHLLKIWPHRQCACSMWNTPTPTGFQQAVNSFPHTRVRCWICGRNLNFCPFVLCGRNKEVQWKQILVDKSKLEYIYMYIHVYINLYRHTSPFSHNVWNLAACHWDRLEN